MSLTCKRCGNSPQVCNCSTYSVKVWPDGSWIGEDDWYAIPEDFSDDYFVLAIPIDEDDIDIDQYVQDHPQTFGRKPKFKR